MRLPDLYTQTKTGKTRKWSCWVEKDIIFRSDGEVTGKMKEPSQRIVEKNTLRTSEQQAVLEAQKYWLNQVDKGYKPDEKDSEGMKVYNYVMEQKSRNGGMSRGVVMYGESKITPNTTSGVKDMTVSHYPMLAKHYLEHLEKVKFPAFVQPKLDGVRCVAYTSNDKVVLESRGGKDYMHLNHIREDLLKILKDGVVLDGELYTHSLVKNGINLKNVERFQFLSEACKISKSAPHPEENNVQFWVFDIYDLTLTNKDRFYKLSKIFKKYKGSNLKLVETHTVSTHSEIDEKMDYFLKEDYEGLMIRNCESVYISKKDYHCDDLLKYKKFEDEEWEIIGAEECKGTQKGAIKWICEKNGNKVTAKQMGTVENCKKLYQDYLKNPDAFNGKMLNIRFNERTKDGVPRFPRATAIVYDKN